MFFYACRSRFILYLVSLFFCQSVGIIPLSQTIICIWLCRRSACWGDPEVLLYHRIDPAEDILFSPCCEGSNWRESWFPVCQPISIGVTLQNSRDAIRKNGGYGKTTLWAAFRPIFSGSIAPIFTNYTATERYVSRQHNGVGYAAFGLIFWPLETKNWQKICHARWQIFSEDLTQFRLTLWQRLIGSSIFRHSR